MALENNGAPNPNSNESGVQNSNTSNESNNNGNRADTSRVDSTGNNGENRQADKGFTYKEDRSTWIPPHRLNEASTAAERRATAAADARYQTEIAARDAKIRMLAGVESPNKEEADAAEVKEALKRLGIEPTDPEREAKLERVLASIESMEQETKTRYENLAVDQVQTLHDEVADLIGVQLSDRQKKSLSRAYRDEAEACMADRIEATRTGQQYDVSNDFLSRHTRRDPTLIAEMAKQWVEDWFEPARRSVTNQAVNRQLRPVPRGGNGRPVIVNRAKPDYSKPGAFEDALVAARADEGNGFSGR